MGLLESDHHIFLGHGSDDGRASIDSDKYDLYIDFVIRIMNPSHEPKIV